MDEGAITQQRRNNESSPPGVYGVAAEMLFSALKVAMSAGRNGELGESNILRVEHSRVVN